MTCWMRSLKCAPIWGISPGHPTSQIVGTQAVLNVLAGERYKTIARETAAILRGEYGATPAQADLALQARVLDGAR